MTIEYDDVRIGDEIPELTSPQINRHVLALFCGASADHNRMHVDTDFAKSFGMEDVFAHGMLSMAYLAQLLTHWVPQSQLREWNARFLSITPLHVRVRCTGKIIEKYEADGEKRVRLQIDAHTDAGGHTLSGEAVIALN